MRHIALIGMILAAHGIASGEIYVVYPYPVSGHYPDIQTAVNYAVDGDIIELADGVFHGTGNRNIDCLGKEITFRSQSGDARSCILDCEAHRGFYLHDVGAACVLAAITVRNGWDAFGGAIYCGVSCSATLRDCIFESNVADYGGAVCCDPGSAVTLIGCTFVGNFATSQGGGICL